jgi:hypothetical protein
MDFKKIYKSFFCVLLVGCGNFLSASTPTETISIPTDTATVTILPTATLLPTATATFEPIVSPYTVFLFTGVIVPARCVQASIDERGSADYIFDEVRELISQVDVAVGTLNATISDYSPHTGCGDTYMLVGGSGNADALANAGFDVMSVATNHIKNCSVADCGDRAFLETLDNLRRVGITPVGASNNLAEAEQPVVIEVNGVRFGIVSLGQIERTTFATDNTPGIAVLTEESLRRAIQAARAVSDVVIAMPHWGPENVPTPNWDQLTLAHAAVEAGADLVVGNHTHVAQGYETIDGVPVFYGLGNFVFDQIWARDHQQSLILLVRFEDSRLLDYQLVPTITDYDGTVHYASADESAQIIQRLEQVNLSLPVSLTPQPTNTSEK